MNRQRRVLPTVFFVLALIVAGLGYQYWQEQQGKANTPPAPSVGTSPTNTASPTPNKAGGRPMAPAPVLLSTAVEETAVVRFKAPARTESSAVVQVRSRIDGQIESLHYMAGQFVREGQLLAKLDSRSLSAQRDQARANLRRDEALLDKAKADWERQKDLLAKGFISPAQLDVALAARETQSATVEASRAALALSTVNLDYTNILAPMNGVIGNTLVFQGNSVKANDTILGVINHIQPMLVTFSIPEGYLPQVRQSQQEGRIPSVEVTLPNQAPQFGKVIFVDNTVDAGTGTIQIKASIPNAKADLSAGQFVEVNMSLREIPKAIVIPAAALQSGPNGSYVYVAKPDKTVEMRGVESINLESNRLVITRGLKPGEEVVVEGHLRLFPGATYLVSTPKGKGTSPKPP